MHSAMQGDGTGTSESKGPEEEKRRPMCSLFSKLSCKHGDSTVRKEKTGRHKVGEGATVRTCRVLQELNEVV